MSEAEPRNKRKAGGCKGRHAGSQHPWHHQPTSPKPPTGISRMPKEHLQNPQPACPASPASSATRLKSCKKPEVQPSLRTRQTLSQPLVAVLTRRLREKERRRRNKLDGVQPAAFNTLVWSASKPAPKGKRYVPFPEMAYHQEFVEFPGTPTMDSVEPLALFCANSFVINNPAR